MTDRTRRIAGLVGLAAILALMGTSWVLDEGLAGRAGLTHPESPREDGYSVVMLTISTMAMVLVWARPRNAVGWLLGLSALLGTLCEAGQVYGARALVVEGSELPAGAVVLALSSALWIQALLLPATLLLARYPSGRLAPGRARLVDRAIVVAMVLMYVGYIGMPEAVTDEVRAGSNPLEMTGWVRGPLLLVGGVGLLAGMLLVAVMSVLRLLRAGYPERQQLALLATTSVLSVVLVLWSTTEWLAATAFTLLPVSIAVGVLRYQLMGIEVVVRRTLLYGSLTGLVLLVFVVTTSTLHEVLPDGTTPEVLAAVVVAVLLAPARDRLQRLVDRFVYGDRDDPWRALDRLGKEAVGPDALHDVVAAMAGSLRVPGAEIRGADGTLASWGALDEAATSVPLVLGGEEVGELVVAPRRGEKALGPADERLLSALSPLLALLVRSTQLTEALRVEQERVVTATESERARLRRDLHDGLGPSLTGVGLGLEAIDSESVPERQRAVVRRLRQEVAASLEEVRRIIDDLRPGALESTDLLTLVRARAEHLTATTPVRVEVLAPTVLHVTPEVEAAALRIVEEALTNVVRHAQATRCTVRIENGDGLRVEVTDDGVGFTGPREGGVGLPSMRSRAAALGGSLELTPAERGTVLVATLPS